jgi:phage shock protein A
VREALTGLSTDLDDVGHTILRAEERIYRLQARAQAVDLLAATGAIVDVLEPAGDDIDRELGRMRLTAGVEADLARLKAEVARGFLPENAGRSPAEPGA